MRRFVTFHKLKSPRVLGPEAVKEYLEYLALERKVSASTQNQALNVLVFLYEQVIGEPIGTLGDFTRAKRPKRLPVVLTRAEANRLLDALRGTYHLMAGLLYGSAFSQHCESTWHASRSNMKKTGAGLRSGLSVASPGAQVPQRRTGRDLAVRVPVRTVVSGPSQWKSVSASSPRKCPAMGCEGCSCKGYIDQTDELPRPAAFLRDPPPRGGV